MRALAGAVLCLGLLGGCAASIEAFAVTLRPTLRCNLTGGTSLSCADTADLDAQRTRGTWVFEHGANRTFSLALERGATLVGVSFFDDGVTLAEPPCDGQGGTCYFARRRFESVDANTGCARLGELVVIVRRSDEDTLEGIVSDALSSDERCGTSTQVIAQDTVEGSLEPTEESGP